MKDRRKRRRIIKRLISGVSALALSVGLLGSIPASADDSTVGYKYTLFAYSSEEGAISSSAANFCVNGNIATNGTISAGQNFNVNGEKKEHANEAMPEISKAINEKFFAENVYVKAENYAKNETNIEVKVPTDVKGKTELKGNIQLSAGLKAMGDITLSGNVLNKNSTVLFSEKGNIVINTENANLTGLIYAPKGNITIESKNLNLNRVVMIANKITLNSPNININGNTEMARFVQESIDKNGSSSGNDEPEPEENPVIYAYGEYNEETKSVDIEWYSNVTGEFAVLESINGTDYTIVSKVSDDTKYSIKVTSDFIKKYYKVSIIKDNKTIASIPFSIVNANGKYSTELLDTDTDGLADLYEEMLGTDKTVIDSDKDGLTDYEEVYITNTDPTKYDSVTEGVSDANADNDKDGLNNKREIELKTDPNSDDTDGDTLKDGDEISKYKTDPLKRDSDEDDLEDDDELKFNCDPNKKDTDNNGIIDGKEKHQQTLDVVPDNKEQPITKVNISMAASGNIEKTTTVESIMGKDVLCSNVVGLVGEPFSIESESSFDKATITFTVDKTKLGETEFDNLMFLWYDRENDNFVELETSHDAANSTVSIETTHFSEYMIVDSDKWWDNWKKIESDWKKYSQSTSSTQLTTILFSHCSNSSDPDFLNPDPNNTTIFHQTNYRTLISEHLIDSMSSNDTMDVFRSSHEKPNSMFSHACFSNDKNYLKKHLYYYLSDPYTGNDITEEIDFSMTLFTKSPRAEEMKNKRIIVITDRDLDVSESELKAYSQWHINAGCTFDHYQLYKTIPIYFVCIGEFVKGDLDNTNLKKIADETNGKVYKVVTLNDLYTDPQFCLISPGIIDTDKDGFTDDEEIYGLVVDSSGTRYKTKPDEEDSDGDKLNDNEEVEVSRASVKTKDNKGNTVWKCYHHMKSIPTNPDSDGDGYYDTCDPDRKNKPEFIGDKYDFMDNEIYFMKGIHDKYLDVQNSSTTPASNVIMYNKNGDDNQKFRFVWAGTGYSIHPLNNEKLALTLHKNENEYSVSLEEYTNSENQHWEILPYTNNILTWIEQGIVIRSQVLSDPDEDGKQKSLYLAYGEEAVIVSTSLDLNCMFSPESIADWVRFGQLYIYYMGLAANHNSDVIRALENYQNNKKVEISSENKATIYKNKNGEKCDEEYYNCLVYQAGGSFTELKFADSEMSEVACEIIATYNAMNIANNNIEEVDFCKLAVEFEINAIKDSGVLPRGYYGSDPERICDCLKAYNYEFTMYTTGGCNLAGTINRCLEFGTECVNEKSAIASYRFSPSFCTPIFKIKIDILPPVSIHTFTLRCSDKYDGFVTYNRWTSTKEIIKEGEKEDLRKIYNSVLETIGEDNIFFVGYVIKNKKRITI